MRSRRFVAAAMILVVTLITVVGPAQAQLEPAPDDPALFDLELARSELFALENEATRLRNELADVLDSIDGLTIDRNYLELNEEGRLEIMQQSRQRARNMAINAYVGIGPPQSSIMALSAETANELSFRNGLLRQQAERLQVAALTYAELAGQAESTVLELSDSINDATRRAEALNRQLNRVVDQIPEARWVVSIAEIHDEADQAFERSGRREPTAEQWRQLRFCESTETYAIDIGNTFYGAYQFTWETWGTVGGSDNPAHAPPAEQDARARLLYARRGAQPWPVCGRFLP